MYCLMHWKHAEKHWPEAPGNCWDVCHRFLLLERFSGRISDLIGGFQDLSGLYFPVRVFTQVSFSLEIVWSFFNLNSFIWYFYFIFNSLFIKARINDRCRLGRGCKKPSSFDCHSFILWTHRVKVQLRPTVHIPLQIGKFWNARTRE
jgi:hypothetical protein